MTVDNYLQEAGAIATLAGILAGFAISAVIQLLSSNLPGRLTSATIVVFSASTVMFLYSLIVFVLLFATTAEKNAIPTDLENLGSYALLVIFGAVYVFLAGIALAGWIRSKLAGIATTIFALTTMCLTTYVIATVISQFI